MKVKEMIVNRANTACGEKRFYKSYIKNLKVVREQPINRFNTELDYEFTYKGKKYRVNEHTVGDSKVSMKTEFELIEIK